MKDYHINIFYSEEDGGVVADIPDLAYCSAFGETPAEAAWLEVVRAEGRTVPEPRYVVRPPGRGWYPHHRPAIYAAASSKVNDSAGVGDGAKSRRGNLIYANHLRRRSERGLSVPETGFARRGRRNGCTYRRRNLGR